MIKKIIYGGISIKETDPTLSDWEFNPPIKRGDLPELYQEHQTPGVILIVDGYFFTFESVTLTEIRKAISSGWQVFGCSSMGALRALESAPIGMRGLGVIYRWMRLYNIEEDDEVAQLLHPCDNSPLTLALVDIRYLMHRLAKTGVDPLVCARIVDQFNKEPYMERTCSLLQECLIEANVSEKLVSDILRQQTLKTRDACYAINYLNRIYS